MQRETTFQDKKNVFLVYETFHTGGGASKSKEFAPSGSKFFPLREAPNEKGCHKSMLLWEINSFLFREAPNEKGCHKSMPDLSPILQVYPLPLKGAKEIDV